MQSYRLRHRIAIEVAIDTQDSQTGVVEVTWQPFVLNGVSMSSVPAEVLTGPGKEAKAAGVIQSPEMMRVNFRWFPGLTEKMRIIWDGRIANITGLETDITGRREWRITAEYGVNDG